MKKKQLPRIATGTAIWKDLDRMTQHATPTKKHIKPDRVPDMKKPYVQHNAVIKNRILSLRNFVVIAKM